MISNTLELRDKCPYCTVHEYHGLKALGKTLDDYVCVVMIGAGPGQLLMSLLEGYTHNNADITVIDIETCQWTQIHIGANIAITTKNEINYIVGDSAEIGKVWNKPIDLLIVDGDHRKEGVIRDIEAWKDHIKLNGIIWFHDYDPSVWGTPTGVKEAIEEAKPGFKPIMKCGCSMVYMK